MGTKNFTQLTALTSAGAVDTSADLLLIGDASAGLIKTIAPKNYVGTIASDLPANLTALSSAGAVDTSADGLLISDASATLIKTISPKHLIAGHLGIYNVKDYGAVGDGTTNDTQAFIDAVAAAGTGGVIYIPDGTFKVVSTIAVETDGIKFAGAGIEATKILFLPTAADSCIHFNEATPSGAPQLNYAGVENLTIYSTDTTYSKTFIRLENAGFALIDRVVIYGASSGTVSTGSTGGAGGTVGIYSLGREQTLIRNCMIQSEVPLRFGPNPNETGGSYDMDHLHVTDVTLIAGSSAPSTLKHSCILIDNDTRVSNATFDGFQAWVGGLHGFYWAQSTDDGISSQLVFSGVHSEQGTSATDYAVYIDQSSTNKVITTTFRNCVFGTDRYGIFIKNGDAVGIYDCEALQSGTAVFLNCDNAVETLHWENLRTVASPSSNLIVLPSDAIRVASGPAPYGSTRRWPSWAKYVRLDTTTSTQRPFIQIGQMGCWTHYTTLAPAATLNIPVNSDYRSTRLGFMDIVATSDNAANTYMASGRIAFAANASGSSGLTISYQDANGNLEVGGATSGKVSVTTGGAQIAADVTIRNNHASQTVKIAVVAWYNRSSEV